MNNLKIEDPQNFEFASTVTKQSKTGFSSNRRLLVVKGGHLYYFSNIPSFFDGNAKSLEYHHELPKHSLQLINIKKIKPTEASSPHFQLIFDQIYLMERQDIRKALVQNFEFKPKKKGEELTWRFSCDNNAIKTKWVSYLAQLKDYFQKQNLKVENLLHYSQLQQKNENMSNYSRMSSASKTPWRQSTAQRKQYSTNDFKSMGDLRGTQQDLYFDQPQKKQIVRMSSTYAPQVDMDSFGIEYEAEQNLTMTDIGMKKDVKMKKLGSTEVGVVKTKYL